MTLNNQWWKVTNNIYLSTVGKILRYFHLYLSISISCYTLTLLYFRGKYCTLIPTNMILVTTFYNYINNKKNNSNYKIFLIFVCSPAIHKLSSRNIEIQMIIITFKTVPLCGSISIKQLYSEVTEQYDQQRPFSTCLPGHLGDTHMCNLTQSVEGHLIPTPSTHLLRCPFVPKCRHKRTTGRGKGERKQKEKRDRELLGYACRWSSAECGQWHDDEKLRGDQYVGYNLINLSNAACPVFF